MARKLMRVPLDFKCEIDKVWEGYSLNLERLKTIKAIVKQVPEILSYKNNLCRECHIKYNHCNETARYCIVYNKNLRKLWYKEPPTGSGYQLWEDTTEGSPQSPVFATLDELAEWCETNAYIYADKKITKEEWMKEFSTKSTTDNTEKCKVISLKNK